MSDAAPAADTKRRYKLVVKGEIVLPDNFREEAAMIAKADGVVREAETQLQNAFGSDFTLSLDREAVRKPTGPRGPRKPKAAGATPAARGRAAA